LRNIADGRHRNHPVEFVQLDHHSPDGSIGHGAGRLRCINAAAVHAVSGRYAGKLTAVSIKDSIPLNIPIVINPYNWIVVTLMILIAGLGLALIVTPPANGS
jgi:hypothetical protein